MKRQRSLAPCDDSCRALILWVDARLDERRLSYAQLARDLRYDRSWISRALSGERLPPWPLIERIADRLGTGRETPRMLWTAAQTAAAVRRQTILDHQVAGYPPAGLADYRQFCRALRDLIVWRGISQRELVKRDATGLLCRSTVGAVLRIQRSAPRDVTIAIVRACGVSESAVHAWATTWDRAAWPHRQAMDRKRRQIAYQTLRDQYRRSTRW